MRLFACLIPLGVAALASCDPSMSGGGGVPPLAHPDELASAEVCAGCHPLQAAEWRGSIMHYAAVSPVFNAFELAAREMSNGLIAPNGAQPNFCVKCHSPIGDYLGELSDFSPNEVPGPAVAQLSDLAQEGITCDFCHTVTGPNLEESIEGDGIANLALRFTPGGTKRGPIDDPVQSTYHLAASTDYLASSEFCGACHDVRLEKPDLVGGHGTQRIENLFTEWAQSAFAFPVNRYGRVISCQDCHMSLFPDAEPGTYPEATIAAGGLPGRRHAIHAFTSVSIPLIDDPRFPNVTSDEVDAFGVPVGQEQRRTRMLRAACTLTLEGTPRMLARTRETIPIRVVVTNVGAGHRVPAGFSQERQVWLHVVVRDDAGKIYESGYLVDRPHPEMGEPAPDGRLHDEDLDDHRREIDLGDWSVQAEEGPDRDQRPAAKLGLVNFQNAFLAIGPGGEHEEILNPLAADGIDNQRSLVPGVARRVEYDVPWPERPISGKIQIDVRLRYRSFPPYLMRALARRYPDLVSEQTVDRNTIVDMAEASAEIVVTPE